MTSLFYESQKTSDIENNRDKSDNVYIRTTDKSDNVYIRTTGIFTVYLDVRKALSVVCFIRGLD